MSWQDLVAGAISGGITSFLFYPLEYLEARMQVSSKKGLGATISTALRDEGIFAFYQVLDLLSVIATISIIF
jgi:hypothetical protein